MIKVLSCYEVYLIFISFQEVQSKQVGSLSTVSEEAWLA